MSGANPSPPGYWYVRRGKRILDVLGASALLVATAPIQLACAAAIVADDGGPVFYLHERVGRNGKLFWLRKFRSMRVGTDRREGVYPTQSSVTKVGAVIRRTSLDELPQLINVLFGDMSLVGPRPALPSHADRYTDEQRRRLSVLPGVTGLAQIRHRNAATWSTRIRTDIDYIESLSLWRDLKIMLATVPAVLSARGQIVGQSASDVDDLGPERPLA